MKHFMILLLAILTHSCMNQNQVAFKPIVIENDVFVEQSPTKEFYTNLEKVLTFYNVDYSIDEQGTILIDEELSRDRDLCWNYTSKARDSVSKDNRAFEISHLLQLHSTLK